MRADADCALAAGCLAMSSLFCSELVAGAFKAMGLLPEARAASDYLPPHFHSSRRRKLPLPRGVALPPIAACASTAPFGRPVVPDV